MRPSEGIGMYKNGLQKDKRGVVAIWIAVMLPGLIMAVSMGVEISNWAAAQLSVQRTADLAALAGAVNYKGNTGAAQGFREQTAATFAARFAQLNGGNGTAAPSWTAGTKTLADNQITAQVVSGVQYSTNAALKVTVARTVPKTISQFFSTGGSVTVSSTSTSELTLSPMSFNGGAGGNGGQPCVIALAGNTFITTGSNITMNGSSALNLTNCTVRSNTGISFAGGATIAAQAAFAGGTINSPGNITTTPNPGAIYQNQGQIPDPYAGNTALQTALTNANSAAGVGSIWCKGNGSGTTCNSGSAPASSYSCVAGGACTIHPGTYTWIGLTGSATVAMSPGLYVFTDYISTAGGSSLSGSDVTIIQAATSGGWPTTITIAGGSGFALSPATAANATGGQIAGVVYASQSTGSSGIFKGNSTSPLQGVIYYPNGTISDKGTAYAGSPACSILIAKTITIDGNSTYEAAACGGYGVPSFGSQGFTQQVGLVR